MGVYTYKVLRKVDSKAEVPDGATIYVDCDEHEAKTPDAAALAAAEKVGQTGSYRPISLRHFNETEIVPTTGFAIGDSENVPPPAGSTGDGAAGDDLDSRLDATEPCQTEECGHLPGEHGAKGLGICRVEGCPCGKYEPAP